MKKCLLFSIVMFNLISFALGIENRESIKSTVSMDAVRQAILDKKEKVTIVDVRDAKTYARGHILGAINIPHDQYGNFQKPGTQFPGLSKDGVNYVYCYTKKCRLAEKAVKLFASMGYSAKTISGGFDSWVENKYPVAAVPAN